MRELFDSGATEVQMHAGRSDQKRVIDGDGNKVLPGLRKIMGESANGS